MASTHSPCVESPEGVQHVSYGEYETLNMIEINNVTSVDPYMCALKINGVSASMEIDTGTAATIISSKQYKLIKQGTHELQLSTANVPTLRTYAGQTIKPAGGVTVDVRHQGCTHRLTCLVVNGNGPNLLGRDWLTQIKLDWSAVHHIAHTDFPHMFPDLFKDGLGKLKDVEAKLYVDKEAMPRCFKPRSVPFALRAKVDNELQRLQTTGVIVPIEHSDWAVPIVPVLKANGEVRICGDYKLTVNKAAKVDQYPIPNIDDLYSKLSGGVAYSKLDLSHAYEQVCLDSESQHLTTITTLKGLFAYTRLCYGVSSASGIFQRAMEQIVLWLQCTSTTSWYRDERTRKHERTL